MSLQPTISWNEVTTNEDGTPCFDLAGYRLYHATNPAFDPIAGMIEVLVPCRTSLKITSGLSKYVNNYFRMTAFDFSGNESTIQVDPPVIYAPSGGLIMK